jgi:hypothetical protein
MPSKSIAQHNLMEMAAHSKTRKKANGEIPDVKVAKEFVKADKASKRWKSVKRVAK